MKVISEHLPGGNMAQKYKVAIPHTTEGSRDIAPLNLNPSDISRYHYHAPAISFWIMNTVLWKPTKYL
jgi:hypothetical protein